MRFVSHIHTHTHTHTALSHHLLCVRDSAHCTAVQYALHDEHRLRWFSLLWLCDSLAWFGTIFVSCITWEFSFSFRFSSLLSFAHSLLRSLNFFVDSVVVVVVVAAVDGDVAVRFFLCFFCFASSSSSVCLCFSFVFYSDFVSPSKYHFYSIYTLWKWRLYSQHPFQFGNAVCEARSHTHIHTTYIHSLAFIACWSLWSCCLDPHVQTMRASNTTRSYIEYRMSRCGRNESENEYFETKNSDLLLLAHSTTRIHLYAPTL